MVKQITATGHPGTSSGLSITTITTTTTTTATRIFSTTTVHTHAACTTPSIQNNHSDPDFLHDHVMSGSPITFTMTNMISMTSMTSMTSMASMTSIASIASMMHDRSDVSHISKICCTLAGDRPGIRAPRDFLGFLRKLQEIIL